MRKIIKNTAESAEKFWKAIPILAISILPIINSCHRVEIDKGGQGYLRIYFSEQDYKHTKASAEIPDTSAFLLKITDSEGDILYDGKYGDAPERLPVRSGTYLISVKSRNFTKPGFSSPLYGDEQCIVVNPGEQADVYLTCEQQNAGVKLKISPDFLTAYPDGVLFLKSSDGRLMYGYSEKRTAYFNPGNITLVLNTEDKDRNLFTKTLKPRQMLFMNISASTGSSASGGSIYIDIDTSRNWVSDSYTIGRGNEGGTGEDSSGDSYKNALSVSKAKSELGAENVWVYGYIVGGDMTSASVSFEPPFSSDSNLAIAGRTTVDEKESCMSVQLTKGDLRDRLNLVQNPGNLKRKVYLKGDIVESYFGIPGIKNITDYRLE